jgi:hypothetical protein
MYDFSFLIDTMIFLLVYSIDTMIFLLVYSLWNFSLLNGKCCLLLKHIFWVKI